MARRPLLAHLKRILKLDRLRLRGRNGARDEFHLATTAPEPPQVCHADPDAGADPNLRGPPPSHGTGATVDRDLIDYSKTDFFDSIRRE